MGWGFNTAIGLTSLAVSILYYLLDEVNLESLCDYEKRPVIFGEEQCPNVFNHKITLTDKGLGYSLVYAVSPKIVLRGRIHNEPVYVKKLATRNAEEFADLLFASTFKNVELNQMAIPLVKIEIFKIIVNHEPTDTTYNGIQKMLFCPKLNRIDQLLVHVPGFDFDDVMSYIRVWTTTLLNAEPFVLKMLQPPKWPVPKYFGSCGRVIFVEDCGLPLTHFINHSWKFRAKLSVQLLEAAFLFTFGHPDLGFYFTDPSPDNIAVDNKGRVKFIDLEHVIIVEKHPPLSEELPNWHVNHTSTYTPCEDCYSTYTEEICSHQISDYNVLSVCREILSKTSLLLPDGLLRDIPDESSDSKETLQSLLEQCVDSPGSKSRFDIAQEIIEIIKRTINS